MERSDVERQIFRNLKITNIEIAKDELFDYFILVFGPTQLLERSKYLIIFTSYKISEFFFQIKK